MKKNKSTYFKITSITTLFFIIFFIFIQKSDSQFYVNLFNFSNDSKSDAPHDVTCDACHLTHNSADAQLTSVTGNANLCMSCHNPAGTASALPFATDDIADPAGSSGNSHAWNVLAVNSTYETNLPSNTEMAARIYSDQIVCSTCHNQHSNTFSSFLRIDNTNDVMCKDCHSARDVGTYATDNINHRGSHPIGVTYNDADDRFQSSPTNTILVSGNVECSSCHQMHYATSSDGNLLRVATNDDNYCKDCHTYGSTGDHNGFGCKDCHQTHNTNKTNIFMIKDVITTPNSGDKAVVFTAETGSESFADGDGTYDGICEVCHTITSYHQNSSAGDHTHEVGNNCTDCHTHEQNFSGGGSCLTCHAVVQNGRRIITSTGGDFERLSHHIGTSVTDADCEVCHDQTNHMAGTVVLKDDLSNTYNYNSSNPSGLNNFCLNCHDADGYGGSAPFSDAVTPPEITNWSFSSHNTGIGSCFGDGATGCHGNGHGSDKINLLAPFDLAANATTKYEEEEGFCFNCHDSDGPATTDISAIYSRTINWAPGIKALMNDRHDVQYDAQSTSGSKIECIDCHDPHTVSSSLKIKADPDPLDSHDPTNSADKYLAVYDFKTEWCLDCHDNTFPTGVSVGGTRDPLVDIKTEYVVQTHGDASGSVGTLEGGYGWTTDITMKCQDCHINHVSDLTATGSTNLFSLKVLVTQPDGVTGIPDDGGSYDYELSNDNIKNPALNGYNWCNTCHLASMGNKKAECWSCHSHDPGGKF